MHSTRTRLNLLIILTVTLVLALSGVYSYEQSREQYQTSLRENEQALQKRLTTILPGILWNFDQALLQRVLDAQMEWADLETLAVSANDGLFAGRERRDGNVVRVDALPADQQGYRTLPIVYEERPDKPIGVVQYRVSTARMDERLHKLVLEKIIEILLLDALLTLTLVVCFNIIIVKPLHTLSSALDHAAGQTHFSLDELKLGGNLRNEFGLLAQSVQRIAARLLAELEERRNANAALKDAMFRADEAYHELKMAQNELVQVEKMASLGGLVAGVAHEVNTPVGVILTSASVLAEESRQIRDLLSEGAVKKSDLVRYCDTAVQSAELILGNAERAGELIRSFKRVAVDQTSEARRTFELGEYLNEVIASLHPTLKRSQLEVEIHCVQPVNMDSYPGALSQVITNFITNAISHAYEEGQAGRLVIHAEQEGSSVTLSFTDFGKGIPYEYQSKIFDPFFTTRRGSGGSGLGLNVVYNLVTQTLAGTIAVKSMPSEGATFIISIPLSAPARMATHETA
ncbi:His Kinase A (phospho-acceptor) domain-containing protein [Andreprevotia lacus DSM 23236]|jgi:signal transduction histidine kinase|uniref:histidine kinase n=1 Tax=Andreprevotia lacus DSM 23236 TaxID=1121001 RepID=A0A1W1XYC4_9NEIS|nr:HAMP domain-containing sensor histidine kinase [Andreprevotia lacus]SMC28892.1 His Kinase A (phospho-acceptor) domain-containing protein [Andreprevotia lacus DSM 23236]